MSVRPNPLFERSYNHLRPKTSCLVSGDLERAKPLEGFCPMVLGPGFLNGVHTSLGRVLRAVQTDMLATHLNFIRLKQ